MIATAPDVVEELRQIVGDLHVLNESADLVAYECDALTHHRYQPSAVVFPGTTQEVSLVMALRLPVIPLIIFNVQRAISTCQRLASFVGAAISSCPEISVINSLKL